MIPLTAMNTNGEMQVDLLRLAVERWREKQLEAVSKSDLKTLKQSYEDPWCAAHHVDSLPVHLKVITPLVRCILLEDEQIAEYLMIERGERIAFPHVPKCHCNLCIALRNDKRLAVLYTETLLQALTSKFYHLHKPNQENTIQQCMNLRKRLNNLEYLHDITTTEQLSKVYTNINDLIVSTFDACNTQEECFALILGNTKNNNTPHAKIGSLRQLAKLELEEPLNHSTAQIVLDEAWWDGFNWIKRAPLSSVLQFLFSFIGYFLITPIFILFPHKKLRPLCYSPYYIHSTNVAASITTVVMVIIWTAVSETFYMETIGQIICPNKITGFDPLYTFMKTYFIIKAVGNIAQTSYYIYRLGGKAFLRNLDVFTMQLQLSTAFFIAGYTVIFISINRTKVEVNNFFTLLQQTQNVSSLSRVQSCVCETWNFSTFPCIAQNFVCKIDNATMLIRGEPVHKLVLNLMSPQTIGAVFIAFANLFTVLTLGAVTYTIKSVGLVSLTITKIVKDISVFIIILLVMMIAWTCYATVLYKMVTCTTTSFNTVGSSAVTFFWSLFTMTDKSSYVLLNTPHTPNYQSLQIIETFGFIGYGMYVIAGAIVMVNLLVAMMSETFAQTSEKNIANWQFQVSLIKINRIRIGADFASPLNLLWPVHLLAILVWDKIDELINKNEPDEPDRSYLEKRTNIEFGDILQKCKQRMKLIANKNTAIK